MYHQGIHIQEPEFLQVRRAAEYAFKNKISMIFLPCHKSHIDYLVIRWVGGEFKSVSVDNSFQLNIF